MEDIFNMENFDMTNFYYASANTSEQKAFRKWLVSHLKFGPVTVDFLKKDGTMRTMKCTLQESAIPTYEKKTERVRTTSTDEAISVVDLEKNEWRSFRYDSVKSVSFTIGE
jgi:glucose-6-phosphate dehydrogenase assembly protein OpcA